MLTPVGLATMRQERSTNDVANRRSNHALPSARKLPGIIHPGFLRLAPNRTDEPSKPNPSGPSLFPEPQPTIAHLGFQRPIRHDQRRLLASANLATDVDAVHRPFPRCVCRLTTATSERNVLPFLVRQRLPVPLRTLEPARSFDSLIGRQFPVHGPVLVRVVVVPNLRHISTVNIPRKKGLSIP